MKWNIINDNQKEQTLSLLTTIIEVIGDLLDIDLALDTKYDGQGIHYIVYRDLTRTNSQMNPILINQIHTTHNLYKLCIKIKEDLHRDLLEEYPELRNRNSESNPDYE